LPSGHTGNCTAAGRWKTNFRAACHDQGNGLGLGGQPCARHQACSPAATAHGAARNGRGVFDVAETAVLNAGTAVPDGAVSAVVDIFFQNRDLLLQPRSDILVGRAGHGPRRVPPMAAGRSDNLLRSVAAAARQVKWRDSRWERSCRSAFSSSASQRNAVHGGDSAASLRAWPAFFRRWLTRRGFVTYASKSAPGDSSSLRGPCILRRCAGVHRGLGLENRRRGSWGRDATALSTAAAFSCCESAAGFVIKFNFCCHIPGKLSAMFSETALALTRSSAPPKYCTGFWDRDACPTSIRVRLYTRRRVEKLRLAKHFGFCSLAMASRV
jgi:hypothetical protein